RGVRRLQGVRLRPGGRRRGAASVRARMTRIEVRKSYKLYIGGAFVRSESGRDDPVLAREGAHVANIARASREAVRDAVNAAPALGAHRDLNAIVDASADPGLAAELDRLAAETVKRVLRIPEPDGAASAREDALRRLEALTELKTAWHPVGA